MKTKKSGFGCQFRGVVLPAPPTLKGRISKSVPEPARGVNVCMKPEKRKILSVPGVGPGPGRTFALIVQFESLVSPALWMGGEFVPLVAKLMTAESNTKSPWKPM